MGNSNEFLYDAPALDWREGLQLGTGRLSAMVYGAPELQRILLNHEWLWRGCNQTKDTVYSAHYLPKVRELLLKGKYEEGSVLGNRAFAGLGGKLRNKEYAEKVGMPSLNGRVDPYQPAGELCFTLGQAPVVSYMRRLDLDNAFGEVQYTTGDGRRIKGMYIASLARDLVIARLTADPGIISGEFWLERINDPECMTLFDVSGSTLIMDGMFQDGIDFRIEAELRISGGCLEQTNDGHIRVTGASEVIVVMNIGTSARKGIPAVECRNNLPVSLGWGELFTEHITEYKKWYDKVSLDITIKDQGISTTDKRRELMRNGASDPLLPLLYFNMGRYMMISGTVNGQLPLNIRAKWNGEINPIWDSDYHNNVNFQMCYWMAEAAGLQDTMPQFFDYVERTIPRAKKAARDLYGCRGVVYPLQTDCWGRATPESFGYAAWIGGGAWLAQHYWKHYEYGKSLTFLREKAYWFMKEVALFYEDYLVEDENGNLQIVPSQSPENSIVGCEEIVTLGVSAACDVQLARELLSNTICAAGILKVDADKVIKWKDMLKRLPGTKIGKRGQIIEWNEDFDEAEPKHRHFSQLYGLFPGDELALGRDEILKAARISIDGRLTGGKANHPLQRAWLTFLYTRLRDKKMAWSSLVDSILNFTPGILYRMDVFLAVPAVICEMLLADFGGKLRFLPALPEEWPSGSVKGLRARGGYTVNIKWDNRRLVYAEIMSISDRVCVVAGEGYSVLGSDGLEASAENRGGELSFAVRTGEMCRIIPKK